jgi:serine/threonine protein kinase
MVSVANLYPGIEPLPGYRLSWRLGRGAFGEVWRAEAPEGRAVAMKFIPCDNGAKAVREIRSLQSMRHLEHPNLVRIEYVCAYGGHLVVAMELADGTVLDLLHSYQKRHGTPIAPEHTCLLLSDAAEALDFLNTRQHLINDRHMAIQHCDVKPTNLLLFGERVKVADFGLCTSLSSHDEKRSGVGTLDYCAPEVFQGRLSSHTDQYALAVTYCVLRGGRLPFHEVPKGFAGTYVRPPADLTMLTPEECLVIGRALDPIPQNRWPSCCEMMTQLTEALIQVAKSAEQAARYKALAQKASHHGEKKPAAVSAPAT